MRIISSVLYIYREISIYVYQQDQYAVLWERRNVFVCVYKDVSGMLQQGVEVCSVFFILFSTRQLERQYICMTVCVALRFMYICINKWVFFIFGLMTQQRSNKIYV